MWTTYPAQAHALPFRTIFGEYLLRRRQDLADAVAKYLLHLPAGPRDPDPLWEELQAAISRSEKAYSSLQQLKNDLQDLRLQPGETAEAFRARLAEGYERTLLAEKVCQVCDQPLKVLLHAMEATAVCLSGGGIRSASFSLGVLEGLARFSRRAACQGDQVPLLDALDYLSTVSGGGYIGSWLMAGAYLAISCITSAMTRTQVVSFIISVVICLFLILAGFPPVLRMLEGWAGPKVVDAVASLSVITHFEGFQKGVLDSRDLLFFLSIIVFSLFTTSVILRTHRAG